MHILLVADGRSPTTLSWLKSVVACGHAASLVSTYPCSRPAGLIHFEVLPVAFAGAGKTLPNPGGGPSRRSGYGRLRPLLMRLRYHLGPLTLNRAGARLAVLCADWRPDMVHGLRIPFEGMLAARAPAGLPVVVSIWGNDLTLHAGGSLLMASETRRVLARAAGLLADTRRDLLLARKGGLREGVPQDCVPGSGGLDLDAVHAAGERPLPLPDGWLQPEDLLLINPRGLRPGSLRTDVFFRALPGFLEACPAARVVCPAMQGEPEAQALMEKLQRRSPGIAGRVMLLPLLPQEDLWRLMHQAQILVSPSIHDGTPNSLLEGLACGCFPVVGDTESMREWIDDGINGLLYPAADAAALAKALKRAAGDEVLRREAAGVNRDLVRSRASRQAVVPVICSFYDRVLYREGQS